MADDSDDEMPQGTPIIGTGEVNCILRELSFYHYINPLRHENTRKYKAGLDKFSIKEFPLEFSYITPATKDPLSAFLHSCSSHYRRCSFRDKQRLRRAMHKWIWRSGLLNVSLKKGLIADTEFADIEAVKNEVREIEDGQMTKKYLKLLSLVYRVDIIMIEPFSDNLFNLIGTGENDSIYMLNMKDELFVPVIVNGAYEYEKKNELRTLRRLYGEKQNQFQKISIRVADTEDIRKNISEIEDLQPTDYDMDDIKSVDDMYADGFFNMLFQIAPIEE